MAKVSGVPYEVELPAPVVNPPLESMGLRDLAMLFALSGLTQQLRAEPLSRLAERAWAVADEIVALRGE